jgi:hypothetical protein
MDWSVGCGRYLILLILDIDILVLIVFTYIRF